MKSLLARIGLVSMLMVAAIPAAHADALDTFIRNAAKWTGFTEEKVRAEVIDSLKRSGFAPHLAADMKRIEKKRSVSKGELGRIQAILKTDSTFIKKMGFEKMLQTAIDQGSVDAFEIAAALHPAKNLIGEDIHISLQLGKKIQATPKNGKVTAIVMVHPELTQVRGIDVTLEEGDSYTSSKYIYEPYDTEVIGGGKKKVLDAINATGVSVISTEPKVPDTYVLKVRGTPAQLIKLLFLPNMIAARIPTPLPGPMKYWKEWHAHSQSGYQWVTNYRDDPSFKQLQSKVPFEDLQHFLSEEECAEVLATRRGY